ncbi:TLD-domain-containing protein [Sistotremastrum niveocremeum HHB9708]|uniref:Oxidation resistance protein 1 n=1 Tax=Sistotremastrum niveocremeum HHB9708 TaxID=1314777 RepID=A0A164NF93_9AGAM|nr:TLD-domain-containing protein [Sistotremastrum niveocremeum HHB9708]
MYAHHSSTRTLPTTARKLLGDFLHSSPPSPHSTPSSLHHHSPHHTAKSINSFLSGYASKAITHATPFSREVFVPPTGAPGFGGDRKWNSKGFEFEREIEKAKKKSVVLQGRREGTESVLSVKLADSIRPNLPALPRLANKWTLLYSLDQHGISLSTFYERCSQNEGGVLLVIKDADEDIFGAWVGEGLRESAGRYYGSGESFLWKRKSASSDDALAVYRWTGKNDYVALCDTDYVSFGGGDGHYGLYLSSSLIEGSSARCPTFDNDILCSGRPRDGYTTNFECVGIEVWAVSP